jgi:hypothetical protein
MTVSDAGTREFRFRDFRPCVTEFASRWKVRPANHRTRVATLPVAPSKSLSTIKIKIEWQTPLAMDDIMQSLLA